MQQFIMKKRGSIQINQTRSLVSLFHSRFAVIKVKVYTFLSARKFIYFKCVLGMREVFSISTKKRKRFVRSQKRTKANKNVCCVFPPSQFECYDALN